ncbi:Putative ribonuclease H protein At1g65750 [Linum grandiflorum]
MRERVRERVGERVSEVGRVRSSGVSVFFPGGSMVDRGGRALQIRDSLISIERSRGSFGSDFRIVVSQNKASHFIFLDGEQLKWLEGVFKVAAERSWVFPSVCESLAKRRTIVVTKFHLRGEPVVKIYERCVNGYVFFVLIPREAKGGWFSFLRLIQSMVSGVSPAVGETRSFAEVVAPERLPSHGRCHLERKNGEKVILVDDVGVKERTLFLEHCLVFRFSKPETVVWDDFLLWAVKSWGVARDVPFSKLGDDLWLMVCSSKAEVDRIIALKRWRFGNMFLLMDKWITEAGRSRVLLDSEVAWITIQGIPIHLKSKELLLSIGDFCGGFICSEETQSLSSARIKIKLNGVIPEEIPICFGGLCFPVSVLPDSLVSPACKLLPSGEPSSWRYKGKATFVSKRFICKPEPRVSGASTSSEGKVGNGKRFSTVESESGGGLATHTGHYLHDIEGQDGDALLGVYLGEESQKRMDREMALSECLKTGDEVPRDVSAIMMLSDKEGGSSNLMGLQLPSLNESGTVSKSFGELGARFLGFPSGGVLGLFSLLGYRPKERAMQNWPLKSLLFDAEGLFLVNGFLGFKKEFVCSYFAKNLIVPRMNLDLMQREFSSRNFSPRTDVSNQRDISEGNKESGVFEPVSCDGSMMTEEPEDEMVANRSEEEREVDDETHLLSAVREVAELIGLQSEGSESRGVDAAIETGKEVVKRRPRSATRSRTELELKRLGVPLDSNLSLGRRPRRSWNIPLITTLRGGALVEWNHLLARLDALPMDLISEGPAFVSWSLESSGRFSVRSLRSKCTRDKFPGVVGFPHYTIWIPSVPTKVQCFVWLVYYKRIATVDNLQRRGLQMVNRCVLCLEDLESVDHLFLHCKFSSLVWSKVCSLLSIHGPGSYDCAGFILAWNGFNCQPHFAAYMKVILHAFCWTIWGERNNRIFRDEFRSSSQLFYLVMISAKNWLSAAGLLSTLHLQEWSNHVYDPG